MDNSILPLAVSAILGGGLFKAIGALIRAFSEFREKNSLSATIGAKTPAEIESVSVATMTSALESAQRRIKSLEDEREIDKKYYQDRISELKDQLNAMRDELVSMERKLAEILDETQKILPDARDTK